MGGQETRMLATTLRAMAVAVVDFFVASIYRVQVWRSGDEAGIEKSDISQD